MNVFALIAHHRLIADLSDTPLKVFYGNNQDLKPGYMPSQVPRSLPSAAKVNALGWQPIIGLNDGPKSTMHSYYD